MEPSAMSCARAEELLSDRADGTLDPVLAGELEAHLAGCAECRRLADALREVLAALRTYPEIEPAPDLARRAAEAALAAGRGRPRAGLRFPRVLPAWALLPPPVPPPVLAVAASLALIASGILLSALGYAPAPVRRAATRLEERADTVLALAAERRDRLVEDVRILRVVISAAFESRMDRMNDRVDDYRRLLERRRTLEQESEPGPGAPKSGQRKGSEAMRASAPAFSQNRPRAGTVHRIVRHGDLQAAAPRALDGAIPGSPV